MAYTLEGTDVRSLNLAPDTVDTEVVRNVAIILSTVLGECPGWRQFGTAHTYLDKPVTAVRTLLVRDVIEAIETNESRAEVLSVEVYRDDELGKLIPRVTIEVRDT